MGAQYSINLPGELDVTGEHPVYKNRRLTTRENLELIYEISNILMQSLDIKEISEKILDALFSYFKQIEIGTILLVDKKNGSLKEIITRSKKIGKKIKAEYSRTIVERTIRESKAIMMGDTYNESEADLSKSIQLKRIRSIMCVPLISTDKTEGVLYVHSANTPHGFQKDDFFFMVGLSSPIALAIGNARLYSQRKLAEEKLKKANDVLEMRIRERTAELTKSNKELNKEIASRIRVEATLRNSEKRYRHLVEKASDIIYQTDDSGHINFTNSVAFKTMGYSEEEFYGRHYLDLVRPDFRGKTERFYGAQFVKKVPNTYFEIPVITKEGKEIWLGQRVNLNMEGDRVAGFHIIARDITSEVRAKRELRINQQQLEDQNTQLRKLTKAVEQSANTVVVTDLEGNIEYINPRFTETTGYTAEEALGQNPRILKSGEQSADFYQGLWQTITSGKEWRGEFQNKRKDGSLYWESATIAPVFDEQGRMTHFIAIKEDITTRKEAEARLRESEERYRSVTQSAYDAIISADGDGNILSWNKGAQTIFGYREEEVLGKSLNILMPERYRKVHQKGLERIRSNGEPHVIDIEKTVELEGLRKDGSEFPFEMALSSWESGGKKYYVGIIRDITTRRQAEDELKRKEMELKEKNRQLERLNRLKSDLMAITSHDLKSPISATIGYANLVLDHINDMKQDKIVLYLKRISDTGYQQINFINDLLDLYRFESGTFELNTELIQLDPLLRSSVETSLPAATQKQITISLNIEGTPNPIMAEDVRIEQVFNNLISNAIKFSPDGSNIEVTYTEDNGKKALITFADEGPGIPEDDLDLIFKQLYRVKKGGKSSTRIHGSGLGLYIVKNIVDLHGGTVMAENLSAGGCRFILEFPIAEKRK